MFDPRSLKRLTVVTGHYGCGKTNLSLNLAFDRAAVRGHATIVDLDVVNPYFRSSDFTAMLAARGVRLIAPIFAGTTLDTPALSASIYTAFEDEGPVIFDVGGDDAGATALGTYRHEIESAGYDLLYVVNRYRNLTQTPEKVAALLPEIELASRLTATGIVNNSHLRDDTTLATIAESLPFAREAAALMGLPLLATTVPRWVEGADAIENAYPIEVYVRTPWETASEVAALHPRADTPPAGPGGGLR